MLRLLAHWVLSAVSVTIVANLLPGFRIATFGSAMLVAAVYGVLEILLYRILAILAFIPMLLSFGLFALVIHAFLLWLTSELNGVWSWLLL